MILLLALNALAVLIFIIYQGTSAVVFSNVFAYGIYFLLHLVIAGVLLLHSVNNGNSAITAYSFYSLWLVACQSGRCLFNG